MRSREPVPARIRLTIAYLGTPFSGWQSQPNGNAVQDHLERALSTTGGAPVRIHGSGRTDTGVHADAQVAHFDAPPSRARMAPPDWLRALNSQLPPEIRVMSAHAAPPDFHARFGTAGKEYRYQLFAGPVLPPKLYTRAWHLRQEVDLEVLETALATFVGRHDFRAFAASRGDGAESREGHAVRTLTRSSLDRSTLTISVEGDGFLYKMVRLLVGSAIHVASGREPLSWLQNLLDDPAAPKSQYCAPAAGLTLHRVHYP